MMSCSCVCLQVICHGIPDKRPLQDGDIVNVDVSVFLNGYHGDLNETYVVGENVDEEAKKLIKATSEVSHPQHLLMVCFRQKTLCRS